MSDREPLAVRGAVVAAAEAVLHMAVMLGWLPLTADQEAQAMLVVALVGTAVLVVWSRGKVTPVADPYSADGVPLVPVRPPGSPRVG